MGLLDFFRKPKPSVGPLVFKTPLDAYAYEYQFNPCPSPQRGSRIISLVLGVNLDGTTGIQSVNLLAAIPGFPRSIPDNILNSLPEEMREVAVFKGAAMPGVPCVAGLPPLKVGDLVTYQIEAVVPANFFIALGMVVAALEPVLHPEYGWKTRSS